MSFSLRQIRYFIAIADSGSISGAAGQLSISQSTITEAIKDLEVNLGVRLLERQARGVALTDKGHLFLRYAKRIWFDMADARRALATDLVLASGKLTIGVSSLVAGYGLAELLARFRRKHSEILVEAVEDTHDYLEHMLLNGEIDIAVVTVSQIHNLDSLAVEVLQTHSYSVWLPSGHALTEETDVDFARILAEPYIQLNVDEIEEASEQTWRHFKARPKVAFRTQSVEAVRSLVATGGGLTILPDIVFRSWSLEGHRLEARPVAGIDTILKVAVVWRRGASIPPMAQHFLDVAITTPRGSRARAGL